MSMCSQSCQYDGRYINLQTQSTPITACRSTMTRIRRTYNSHQKGQALRHNAYYNPGKNSHGRQIPCTRTYIEPQYQSRLSSSIEFVEFLTPRPFQLAVYRSLCQQSDPILHLEANTDENVCFVKLNTNRTFVARRHHPAVLTRCQDWIFWMGLLELLKLAETLKSIDQPQQGRKRLEFHLII